KTLGIWIHLERPPSSARIGGLINPRLLAWSATQEKSGLIVDGLHAAKIQVGGAGDSRDLPVLAAVGSVQISAPRSASPNDARLPRAHASPMRGCKARLRY